MGRWLFSGTMAHWRMQRWEETPATIVRAKLESHSGSKGGSTYRGDRRIHVSIRRPAVHGQPGRHQRRQRQHRIVPTGRASPIECSSGVGPPFPLLRQSGKAGRGDSLPRSALGDGRRSDGLWQRCSAWRFWPADLRRTQLVSRREAAAPSPLLHPDEPWLCKTDWAEGKIKSSSEDIHHCPAGSRPLLERGVRARPGWRFPVTYSTSGHRLALLLLAFPAIGAILILCAVVSVLRLRKYGQSVFEMASVPGVIGGQLAGVIRVSKKVAAGRRLSPDAQLRSQVTTTTGKKNSTSENVVWQDEQLIAHELSQSDPEQSAIPVLFQIPYECRPTDETEPNNQTVWRLGVSAKTPGLDYSATFEVPVFKTPESDPNFVVDRSLIAQYVAPEDPDRDLHDAGVIKTQSPSGEGFRLVFPMGRATGTGVATDGSRAGVRRRADPDALISTPRGWSTSSSAVVFGAVGLLLLAVSVDVWFYRSVVDVSPAGLTVVGGLLRSWPRKADQRRQHREDRARQPHERQSRTGWKNMVRYPGRLPPDKEDHGRQADTGETSGELGRPPDRASEWAGT